MNMFAAGLATGFAHGAVIFTEDFESPVGDPVPILAGATTFDNPVVAAVTPNISGWAGRMQQTEAGLIPFSGNQFYEMNGGWAIDSSILFEVAAANTLTNGSTLTVSLYSAGAFSDTVDETFDVILSGGAVGTHSAVSDGPQDVWQQHTFNFIVTDATQAVNLEILAKRNSTFDEDLLIDLITVTSEVGNDFSAWIAGFPVGGLTGFNDDFDLDGLANGIENFFGTNPGVANTGLTEFSSDGTSFTFQHPQNATPASDVTGSYHWSPDLENWHNSGDMVGGTVVTITPGLNDPVAGTTTVTAAASGTIPTRLFVRVKVRQTM